MHLVALAVAMMAAAQPGPSSSSLRPFAPHPSAADNSHAAFAGPSKDDPKTKDHDPIYPHILPEWHHHKSRSSEVVPGVYICKGPGWTNSCNWQRNIANTCMQLPASNTLAVGPDIGIQCALYSGSNCDGTATSGLLVAPGMTDLSHGFDGLPDGKAPKSYMCRRCGAGNLDCGAYGVPATYRWMDLV